MTWQIFAAEISFHDTPLRVRETFSGTEKNIKHWLSVLRPRVHEIFILSTPQRFTVYVVHDNLLPLTGFFHDEQNLKGYVQLYYNSSESVSHLMATASGLLSPVKGEAQVLDQIMKCYEWAADSNCLGITLDNTLRKAIETGKAVRTKTGIDKFCASLVETGIDLLYNQMQDLHKKNFLVFGTGNLAELAVEYLSGEGIRNIAVSGYDHPEVVKLAARFGIRAFPIHMSAEYFAGADIIIGASKEQVKIDIRAVRQQQLQRSPDRAILDFGMPPNFDDELLQSFAEVFYNIDDLRRIQPSVLESFGGLEEAWRMVVRASNDFVHLLQLLNHSPVLTAYLSRQFNLRNGVEWKIKPRRTLKSLLLFKKQDSITGVSPTVDEHQSRLHVNNYLPENGHEIVRNAGKDIKFRFYLSEN